MSSQTTYTCDGPCCGEKISDMYGPLTISVSSRSEPQCDAFIHVCSIRCAHDWFHFNGGGAIRYAPGALKVKKKCHVETRFADKDGRFP